MAGYWSPRWADPSSSARRPSKASKNRLESWQCRKRFALFYSFFTGFSTFLVLHKWLVMGPPHWAGPGTNGRRASNHSENRLSRGSSYRLVPSQRSDWLMFFTVFFLCNSIHRFHLEPKRLYGRTHTNQCHHSAFEEKAQPVWGVLSMSEQYSTGQFLICLVATSEMGLWQWRSHIDGCGCRCTYKFFEI
jgi:hypothetical protein